MKCSLTKDSSASSRSSAISATTPATMALVMRNHSSRLQLPRPVLNAFEERVLGDVLEQVGHGYQGGRVNPCVVQAHTQQVFSSRPLQCSDLIPRQAEPRAIEAPLHRQLCQLRCNSVVTALTSAKRVTYYRIADRVIRCSSIEQIT